jgi:hypothetical protein
MRLCPDCGKRKVQPKKKLCDRCRIENKRFAVAWGNLMRSYKAKQIPQSSMLGTAAQMCVEAAEDATRRSVYVQLLETPME